MGVTKQRSRREFLQGAIASAAGAGAFPDLVPAAVMGVDAAGRPNDRIALGFIGMGKQGLHLLNAFLNERGVQVLAVCDVDAVKLQRAHDTASVFYARQLGREKYSGISSYRDFRDLLARKDIDAAVTALPDHWHAVPAIEAARLGKDVYGEKPMANSIGECRAMVEAARRHGQIFQTGSMQRSDIRFRFACELVRNGYIGDLKKVTVNIGGPPDDAYVLPAEPVPDYLDWDFWLGPAPWRPYSPVLAPPIEEDRWARWRHYWDFGGGGMTDWGAHHFDIGQWGMGMDRSGPLEIHPPNGRDFKMLTYRYASGVIMTREEGVNGVLFTGSEGQVEVNRGYLRTNPESLMKIRLKPGDIPLYRSANHRADWLSCIRTRRLPICDAETGCRSATVCHLGNIAYRLGRSLRWDPVAEQFVNDEAANRMISRPYRSPWQLA